MCSMGISTNAKERKNKTAIASKSSMRQINLLPSPSSVEVVDPLCKNNTSELFATHTQDEKV